MESQDDRPTFKMWMRKNLITILLVAALIIGLILAIILLLTVSEKKLTTRMIMYIGFPGELLLHGLQCIALPLTVPGLVLAATSLKIEESFELIAEIVFFIILFTAEASVLGVLLASWIVPRHYTIPNIKIVPSDEEVLDITAADMILDWVRNIFPSNVIGMTMMHYKTVLVPSNKTTNSYNWEVHKPGEIEGGENVLGMIFYSLIFAAAIWKMQNTGENLLQMLQTLSRMALLISKWLLWAAPFCSLFVITATILKAQTYGYLATEFGFLLAAILVGHVVQCFVVYPLVYLSLVWENPFIVLKNFLNAIIIAFVTSSSWITLPITIICLEELDKMPDKLVRIVVPISHTLSKQGSAIYFTAIILSTYRMHTTQVDMSELLKICFFGSMFSVAATGTPYSNILCYITIAETLDFSATDISLILAVDWIASRTSNVVNVVGDLYLAKILAAYNSPMFVKR